MKSTSSLYRTFFVAVVAILISGCVSTHVTSKALLKNPTPIDEFVLILKTGKFQGNGGIGSGFGQRNLDSIVPHLATQLPAVFSANGIQMKLEASVFQKSTEQGKAKVLVVKPMSATYSTQSGQSLTIRAEILDVNAASFSWYADITMHTLGFGKFDEELANRIAVKLVNQLREDGFVANPKL